MLGGVERESNITSNRCFIVDERGRLAFTSEMHVGRQYATLCTDGEEQLVYAIGGYNSTEGILASFETFNIRARKWQLAAAEH